MNIQILRHWFTLKSSIGVLTVEGFDDILFTIEDPARARGVKIYAETAISEGEYDVRITMSSKYGIHLPQIYNQPDHSIQHDNVKFTGVRIHKANWAKDLKGCIAPGLAKGTDAVWSSAAAMDRLNVILDFTDTDTIHKLTIINQQET